MTTETKESTPKRPRLDSGDRVRDLRIRKIQAVTPPQLLLEQFSLPADVSLFVESKRLAASNILHGKGDDRLIVIVGPCSIHDCAAGLEYANKLHSEAERLKDDLLIIMRVYFEKPRTTIGWRGLINDPDLDNTYHINKGLKIARGLLLEINKIGVPVGCEFLDSMFPQYIADLVTWGAIGARTNESQLHRELASGLSMPIGFKNGTGGDVQIAVDACKTSNFPHSFLGITKQGVSAICHSMGNEDTHVILRGGSGGPNYSKESVQSTGEKLRKATIGTSIIVDCSHGNSCKDFRKQKDVCKEVCDQVRGGERVIAGVMIESNMSEGSQSVDRVVQSCGAELNDHAGSNNSNGVTQWESSQSRKILDQLTYGVSITDGCIGWEETQKLLQELADSVKARRSLNVKS